MYCIYRITNKLNGKTYIGQHKYKDLSVDTYMGSGKYLWKAYNKYGIENFEKEILISEIETREEINKLEIEYIKSERENGHGEYNISRGGDGGWFLPGINNPRYGKHLPEEHRKNISKASKGKHISEETKRKMAEALKGENNPMYGKHLSEETREKISEALKGIFRSEETKKKMSESKKGENHPNYGKHLSEETRNKISESNKSENNPFYGKFHSDESKMKISKASKGRLFYNNGIECHRYIPGTEPKGYILGKLPKIKEN